MKTIYSLLHAQAQQQPDRMAILGVGGNPCSYQQLFQQVQFTQEALNVRGIGRNDPVAIVLPNGPILATVFLSIASSAACAPLNPAYTATEFEFFLQDLDAKAVVVEVGSESPVWEVADQLGIPIIALAQNENRAVGLFTIVDENDLEAASVPEEIKQSDIALILHTSGTTSRPKMVPLTQKNLCTSAHNICASLQLSPEDLCLNIMPLFHIHGLLAAVMASIKAGGGIVCTPGFYAPKIFDWLDRFHPTWFTAVPTMHQAILDRARRNPEIIQNTSLRFIRSSSAPLAPNLMADIEATFAVPVIEAYGMTEAAHQMASNPLPPRTRKPGSVGLPAGPEIAIMHEGQPTFLPRNEGGEVVIRGENVTLGYMNNEEANQHSFVNGWFRTGDQGYLDSDGYLFITGRLKEIINRGGEKISPREVDEVLLSHSDVLQAVTFGVPDKTLGEEIAAVVVLKDKSLTEFDLKQFAAMKLAQHKVPTKILIVDEIPKGSTGKVQRLGLSQKFDFGDRISLNKPQRAFQPPKTEIEKRICAVWQDVLGLEQVSIEDHFRDIGGDSMLATLIHNEVELLIGQKISLVELYAADTVSKQAALLENLVNTNDEFGEGFI